MRGWLYRCVDDDEDEGASFRRRALGWFPRDCDWRRLAVCRVSAWGLPDPVSSSLRGMIVGRRGPRNKGGKARGRRAGGSPGTNSWPPCDVRGVFLLRWTTDTIRLPGRVRRSILNAIACKHSIGYIGISISIRTHEFEHLHDFLEIPTIAYLTLQYIFSLRLVPAERIIDAVCSSTGKAARSHCLKKSKREGCHSTRITTLGNNRPYTADNVSRENRPGKLDAIHESNEDSRYYKSFVITLCAFLSFCVLFGT